METQVKRKEEDLLGVMELPSGVYWGIHTQRAVANFPLSGRQVNPSLIRALALVKKACAAANVQVPAVTMLTVVPDTVHTAGVLDVYVTGVKPAEEVASGAMAKLPPAAYVCAACAPQLSVCVALLMTTVVLAVAAAR